MATFNEKTKQIDLTREEREFFDRLWIEEKREMERMDAQDQKQAFKDELSR
jgi:hypothetical protein